MAQSWCLAYRICALPCADAHRYSGWKYTSGYGGYRHSLRDCGKSCRSSKEKLKSSRPLGWEQKRGQNESQIKLKEINRNSNFAAIAVVGSLFSFPVFGSKCAPVQHLVNVLCAVLVGPWWGLAQAFIASLIRNLLALGSPLAFPGSMCGALLGGLLYKYGKKLPFAYIGEVVGTGIIGGMLSYPVAYLVMGNTAAALFTFVVPFLISTCGGTIIAMIITIPLKKSGMLAKMKDSLEN